MPFCGKLSFWYEVGRLAYFKILKYNKTNSLCEVDILEYLTVKEAGEKWGITGRMVTHYCVAGRIKGALKKGNLWLVPADAKKPVDGRCRGQKQ